MTNEELQQGARQTVADLRLSGMTAHEVVAFCCFMLGVVAADESTPRDLLVVLAAMSELGKSA